MPDWTRRVSHEELDLLFAGSLRGFSDFFCPGQMLRPEATGSCQSVVILFDLSVAAYPSLSPVSFSRPPPPASLSLPLF